MANIPPDINPVSPSMPYNSNIYNDGTNTIYVNVNIINGVPSTANTNAPTIDIRSFSEVDPFKSGVSGIGYNSVIFIYNSSTQVTGTYQYYPPGSHTTIITPSSLISGGATNVNIGTPLYILFYSLLDYRINTNNVLNLPPSFNPNVGSTSNPGGLQTGYIIIVQPCGAPTSLSATSYQNGQVPLSWTEPTDKGGSSITSYIVQWSSSSSTGPWISTINVGLNTYYVFTGLTNGNPYWFQVAALNAFCNSGGPGSGPFSISAGATPATTPDPPTATDITTTEGVNSISVVWKSPLNNGGATITSYTLQYRVSGSGSSFTIISGIQTTPTPPHYIITGLLPSTTYEIQVASVNIVGQGLFSSSVFGNTDTTPDNPTNFQGNSGDQQVSLSWTAPQNDGGTPVTGYLIEFKLDSLVVPPGSWTSIFSSNTTPPLFYTIGPSSSPTPYPLTNGTLYDFRVSAVNAVGTGSHSNIIEVTPSTIPGPPTSISAFGCDNQQVLVTWSPPTDTGGATITSYNLQYSTSSTGPWLTPTPSSVSPPTTSYTFTGLTNGTQYYFQVQAVNMNGPGPYSAQTANSTAIPSITPQPPPIPITTTAITSSSITLSWTAPTNTGGNPVTGYLIYWSQVSPSGTIIPPINSYNTTTSGTPLATTYTITGLTYATLYAFQISSINCSGIGPISAPAFYVTTSSIPPSAPTNLTITGCNTGYTNSVILTWTAPASNGGSPITNYIVYYRTTSPVGTWYTYNTNSNSTTAIVPLPASSTSYDFKVAAQNIAGVSIFSPIVSSSSYNPPTAPTNHTATNFVSNTTSNGSIVLTWTPSTQEPPQTISYYVVEYKICEFGGYVTHPTTITFPSNSVVLSNIGASSSSNIANNVPYLFRVYAVNSCGARSPLSNTATATSYNNAEPTRLWSRFNLNCSGNITSFDSLTRNMLRKGQVLQYPVVGTLQYSRATLWSMAAKNQLTRKKAWASQSEEYTYPNTTNINNEPDVGLRQTPTSLVCWRQPPSLICNSSTASDVPGNPTTLCLSKNAPFDNFRRPITYSSGGTKFPVFFSK